MKGDKAYAADDLDGAISYYKKGVDTGRAKFKKKVMYSFLLTRADRPDDALEVLNPLLMNKYLKPEQRFLAKQYRCMANYRKGDIDEALEEARELFDNGYKNTFLYSMIGYFMILKKEDPKKILEFCKEAYEYNSDERDIIDNLTTACILNNDMENAKQFADLAVEKFPDFVEGRYHAALVYTKLKDKETALFHIDNMDNCKRTPMTTITENDINELKKQISNL